MSIADLRNETRLMERIAELEAEQDSLQRAVRLEYAKRKALEAERAHGMKFAQALAAHKSAATTEIYLRDRVAKAVKL